MSDKVVLAYSGGLETSVCIHWLRHKRNLKVIACTVELGGGQYLQPVAENAIDAGATAAHISDLRQRFVCEFVLPALHANARYEREYYLHAALSRPLIAAEMVRIAKEENCHCIAHGASLSGNDPARFETAIANLAPSMKVIHPPSEWTTTDRDGLVAYAERHNIPYSIPGEPGYSIDANLWGTGISQGEVADPWIEPPSSAFLMTTAPEKSPDQATVVEINFEAGIPCGLDGMTMDAMDVIVTLNELGGSHGVGRFDCIENRFQAIKTREIYEAPAAKILVRAHEALEDLTLSKASTQFKELLSRKYAELIYNGHWFSDLRVALDQFFRSIQASVTGDVRMKLYKGHASVLGRRSEYSLYEVQQEISSDVQGFNSLAQVPNQAEAKLKADRRAQELQGEQTFPERKQRPA